MTDVGMCGDYYSVIGMKVETSIPRFLGDKRIPMSPAESEATVCAVFVETDEETGLCKSIRPIRLGPHLQETL